MRSWRYQSSVHENETGSLYFGPLRKRSLSVSFHTILRSPVTIWPHLQNCVKIAMAKMKWSLCPNYLRIY